MKSTAGSVGSRPQWLWLTPLLSPHPAARRHTDAPGLLLSQKDRVTRSGAGRAFPPNLQLLAAPACEFTECIIQRTGYITVHFRARTCNDVQGTHWSCHVPRSRWFGRLWNPVLSRPRGACTWASALNQSSNGFFSTKVPTSRHQAIEVGVAFLMIKGCNSWKKFCFPSP